MSTPPWSPYGVPTPRCKGTSHKCDITWAYPTTHSAAPSFAMPKDKKKRGIAARPPRVRVTVPVQTANGGSRPSTRTLTTRTSTQMRDEAQKSLLEHYNGTLGCPLLPVDDQLTVKPALPAEGRLAFNKLRDIPDPEPPVQAQDDWDDLGHAGLDDLEDALNGNGMMESAGGGEFRDTLEEVIRREREREQTQKKKFGLVFRVSPLLTNPVELRRYPDYRKRRRRVEEQVNAFEAQMDAITNSYMAWSTAVMGSFDKERPQPPVDEVKRSFFVVVIDVFRAYGYDAQERR